MKTTVEPSDELLGEAKAFAARNGMSLRQVIEESLRSVLHWPPASAQRLRLKTVTTKGEGLLTDSDWNTNSLDDLRRPRQMLAVDTNILVYSVREDSPWHKATLASVRRLAE